ncbi:MAG: hypothetical protein ACOC9Y_04495 [Chloroflexota bacterium]
MQSLLRGPLFIVIPLLAIIFTVVIGVGIGLSNLWVYETFDSKIAPVVSAGTLTILIMGVATYLSLTSPDPNEPADQE